MLVELDHVEGSIGALAWALGGTWVLACESIAFVFDRSLKPSLQEAVMQRPRILFSVGVSLCIVSILALSGCLYSGFRYVHSSRRADATVVDLQRVEKKTANVTVYLTTVALKFEDAGRIVQSKRSIITDDPKKYDSLAQKYAVGKQMPIHVSPARPEYYVELAEDRRPMMAVLYASVAVCLVFFAGSLKLTSVARRRHFPQE